MPSLIDIKNKITSIKSTKKITSAMKMISASYLDKGKKSMHASNSYTSHLEEIVSNLLSKKQFASCFISGNGSEKIMQIALTSNKSLCGGFNSSIINTILPDITDNSNILPIGKNGAKKLDFLYSKKILSLDFEIIKISEEYIENLFSFLMENFENNHFGKCFIYYNHFVSTLQTQVKKIQLFPISLELQEIDNDYLLLEPSKDKVFDTLIPLYIKAKLVNIIYHSNASEHASRMIAMDNSIRNCEKFIEELTIKFNRTRQARVTNELIEIIAGAEAT